MRGGCVTARHQVGDRGIVDIHLGTQIGRDVDLGSRLFGCGLLDGSGLGGRCRFWSGRRLFSRGLGGRSRLFGSGFRRDFRGRGGLFRRGGLGSRLLDRSRFSGRLLDGSGFGSRGRLWRRFGRWCRFWSGRRLFRRGLRGRSRLLGRRFRRDFRSRSRFRGWFRSGLWCRGRLWRRGWLWFRSWSRFRFGCRFRRGFGRRSGLWRGFGRLGRDAFLDGGKARIDTLLRQLRSVLGENGQRRCSEQRQAGAGQEPISEAHCCYPSCRRLIGWTFGISITVQSERCVNDSQRAVNTDPLPGMPRTRRFAAEFRNTVLVGASWIMARFGRLIGA
ncbi:hypothetical protein GCM10007913_06770 [Devosia yakushimensis]|uniref:Uncharacterized protein n=1 Tax=Devosia yakushimensis TaxID=470028 RepID=A0ABQ5U9C9_9HYPH|nr:hypothetical protein GCM10007913_06770 [Devosia yakushimensis]